MTPDLPLLRLRADVGDDTADLIGGADLGSSLARLGREDGVEMRVEGEEHRRRHGGEEHHPQHGILYDQARTLHIRGGKVAAAPEAECQHAEQDQREEEINGYVGEPDHVRPETGVGQVHGVVLVQNPIEGEPHERHAEQRTDAGVDQPGASAVGCALVHAHRKALADQPGDDQHHALHAERDEHRQQRCAGEISEAVEGRIGGGQR